MLFIHYIFYHFFQIVGNITTYMLILIQFLITSHSCDEKFVV